MASQHDRSGGGVTGRSSKLNGLLFVLGLAVVWELTAQAQLINPLVVPPLSKILRIFWELSWSGQIPWQIIVSMKRAAVGYFLAAAVFIPLGIFMGLSPRIHRMLEVVVEMLRPVPPPVVIPVAMLLFGLEDEMKIFVIFFSCAWPILLNTIDGVRNLDWVLLNTAKTFGLSRRRIIRQVILPACSPQIVTGLRVSLPIMLILVVISEMVGSTDGIGYFILDSQRRFRVPQMYAGMLALAILGYTLNQIFNLLQRALLPWHGGMMRRREEG
ncbi:MAG TPA: ABC transporter permease [Verrucomicrobiae bacterium]|nr:ABC transporter permease [Verrucomicrobiae bacterium]